MAREEEFQVRFVARLMARLNLLQSHLMALSTKQLLLLLSLSMQFRKVIEKSNYRRLLERQKRPLSQTDRQYF